MSDGELFAALFGALAVALWLRRSIRKRASGKKIGIAAANAAIVGVVSAVLGATLIKSFRGSFTEISAVVLVIGGLGAMGIGFAVSVISAFRGLWGSFSSNVEVPEATAGLLSDHSDVDDEAEHRFAAKSRLQESGGNDYPTYFEYLWITGQLDDE